MAPKRVTGDLTISTVELRKMSQQLRSAFLKEVQENAAQYDPLDVEKIRSDDFYCDRFILHQRYLLGEKATVDDAIEQCKTALKWRKEFNANAIKESSLSVELFELKAVFPYGKDKLGNYTLVIIGKHHKRDASHIEEVRRFLIYWIEKMDRQGSGNKINVILSCDGAGISNLDLDIIRFIFNIFRQNYPYFLENIFVFNMPWIFIPAWKIIKGWLPEDAVDKIKFVNKKTILEYIDEDSLPVSLGGNRADHDNEHIEEYKKACKEQLEQFMGQGTEMPPNNELHDDDDNIPKPKRVYLDVKPGPILQFSQPDCKERKTAFLVLTNVYDRQIGFRIRCNSTESFKVRPFSGVLQIGSSIDVSIHLLEGHSINGREKFLIQAIPVGHGKLSSASFKALWDNSHHSKQMEYKIKCQYEKDEKEVVEEVIKPVFVKDLGSAEFTRPKAPSNGHDHQIISLEASIRDLKYWNSLLKIAVFFLLLLNFLFFTNYFFHQQISHHSSYVYNLIFPTTENSQRSEENELF